MDSTKRRPQVMGFTRCTFLESLQGRVNAAHVTALTKELEAGTEESKQTATLAV